MKKFAPLFVLLAGCLWGSMGLFVRPLNAAGFSSMHLVEARALLTALILIGALGLVRPALLRVRPRDLWCFAGTGIASMIFFNYCYFSTIVLTSLSTAAVLLYTAPIFVMLFSVPLFGEALTARGVACLALTFAGCVLVSGEGGGAALPMRGLLLGLGSGLGYALYSIFSRFALRRGYPPLTITAYTFLFAAAGGVFLTDFSSLGAALRSGGAPVTAFLVAYTLITTVLPYIFYTTGLQYVATGAASVMASVEPVVATLLGMAVYRESLTPGALCGVCLVLGALTWLNLPQKRKNS